MSLSDEFFKEEDQNKTPLAKWLAILIVSIFALWLIWAIFFGGLFEKKEKVIRPLTPKEKQDVLDNLSKDISSTEITTKEKEKVLNNLSKKTVNTPTVSDEEKNKILQGLQ